MLKYGWVCDSDYATWNKKINLTRLWGALSKAFNNALQSLWTQSIWSSWAAPRDEQTISWCLQLLFSTELTQTANSPRERKEIKCNAPNLYPGADSFIFESLAAFHANKRLLKDTEQEYVRSGSRVHSWQAEVVEVVATSLLRGFRTSRRTALCNFVTNRPSSVSRLNLSQCQTFIQWLTLSLTLFPRLSFTSAYLSSHAGMFRDINIFFIQDSCWSVFPLW